MPVYNERATIERAIDAVLDAEAARIVRVDRRRRRLARRHDASSCVTDRGPEHVRVLTHDRNRGQGSRDPDGGSRTRAAPTRRSSTPISSTRRPTSRRSLEPLQRGDAEAVFGTRAFRSHSAYSFWYVVGNRAVTFFANVVYNCWVSDMMTGHKAIDDGALPLARASRARLRGRGGDHRAPPPARRFASTRCPSSTRRAAVRKGRS